MKYRKIEIENSSWSAKHDLERQVPFSFTLNGDEDDKSINITLKGISVASFDESMAIPIKAVRHDFMEEDGYRVETASVIPFGSEPAVLRKFEYFGNIIKITTDLRLKAPAMGKLFSLDELLLTGNWKKYAVIGMSSKFQIDKKIKWNKIPESDKVLYDSNDLFEILLLEDENGSRIEVGTGFDLWRWNIAQNLDNIDGQLKIELIDGAISLKRHLMTSDSEFEIPKRDWRFNWYMAWDCSGDDSLIDTVKGASISVKKLECPDAGMVKEGDVITNMPCFHSKAARNRLKKWVRSQLGTAKEELLVIKDMIPHICGNQAHLDRAKCEKLLHWDLADIMDFWFWGNRQLRKKDSFLSIFPEKSGIFGEFPSFKAMKRVVKKVPSPLLEE